jgi:hypothetical protein
MSSDNATRAMLLSVAPRHSFGRRGREVTE